MRMEAYEVAQLIFGLGTLVATGAIVEYSRTRAAAAPDPEVRKAFRPLYVFAVGLLIYAVASLLTFYELFVQVPIFYDYYIFQYMAYYLEVIVLSVAASMILRQYYPVIIFTVLSAAGAYLLFLVIQIVADPLVGSIAASPDATVFFNAGSVMRSIMLSVVAGLFAYIAYDTRRSTSTALAYGMFTQLMALPGLYRGLALLPQPATIIVLFVSLMGPAMIIYAFLKPEQELGVELLGYGASFAGPALVVVAALVLLTEGAGITLLEVAVAPFGSLSILLGAGTASYLYGRWRETRQTPTFLLMFVMISLSAAHLVGMIGQFGLVDYRAATYAELLTVGFGLSLFAVIAILAAGYRSIGLLPFLFYLPVIALVILSYNQGLPVDEAFLSLAYLLIPLIGVFFLPVVLFAGVWWRMKASKTRGAMRPLGLSLGLLIYLVIRIPYVILDIPGLDPSYGLVAISFILFWLAITGRLERLSRNL
jgi:hypothetical protein